MATSTPPRPEDETQQTAANEGQKEQVTETQFEFNTQYSLAGGNYQFCLPNIQIVNGSSSNLSLIYCHALQEIISQFSSCWVLC